MENEENLLTPADEGPESIEDILDEMEDIITAGRQILLTNRVTIDPDEFLDLIDRMRKALPSSVRQAEEIASNCETIINEAEIQADAILENARKKALELTSAAVPYNVREEAKKLLESAIRLAEEEQE